MDPSGSSGEGLAPGTLQGPVYWSGSVMPWIMFLLALAALAVAFTTASMALLVFCLIAAFGLTVAGMMQLFARRISNRSRDESLMLDPDELRRLREQAEARRLSTSQDEAQP